MPVLVPVKVEAVDPATVLSSAERPLVVDVPVAPVFACCTASVAAVFVSTPLFTKRLYASITDWLYTCSPAALVCKASDNSVGS